jgi:hypothetical protein
MLASYLSGAPFASSATFLWSPAIWPGGSSSTSVLIMRISLSKSKRRNTASAARPESSSSGGGMRTVSQEGGREGWDHTEWGCTGKE